MSIDFKKYIASVKDFPNEGIIFRDITPILQDGEAFAAATHEIAEYAKSRQADVIVGSPGLPGRDSGSNRTGYRLRASP